MDIRITINGPINEKEIQDLCRRANGLSTNEASETLIANLKQSHTVVTARQSSRLVGLANAVSDVNQVVYYKHLLVSENQQAEVIGREIMETMQAIYGDFEQQMLTATEDAPFKFYESMGFQRSDSHWVYCGS